MDMLNDIMKYENGEMDHEEVVKFFQKLLNTGYINVLQGHYGRTMQMLIENGDVC